MWYLGKRTWDVDERGGEGKSAQPAIDHGSQYINNSV